MKKTIIGLFIATALAVPSAMSQQTVPAQASEIEADEDNGEEQDNDEDIRQNPTFDFEFDTDDIDIPVPAFIHQNANQIILNGADWTPLYRAFANAGTRPVSIVHIGDSHIQADINTSTVRNLLQYDFGNSGRGIITPLKMSGTNQPQDYLFNSSDNWTPVKLMNRQWPYTMGFTGTSIHPKHNCSSFTIGTKESDDYNPFSSFTIFHGGKLSVDSVVNSQGYQVHFRAIPSRDYTQIIMASQETQVKIFFNSKGDLTLYGVSLSGGRPGVFYHAIGNNGATYSTYNRIGNVGAGISPLNPDLVIISLGTNEAFGRLDTDGFYKSIDRLVRNIRSANPTAQILLVTPMECQRSVSRVVSKKVKVASKKRGKKKRGKRRGRGSRTKTVKTRVKSYAANTNIQPLRDEIMRYGHDNGIAVLDWWEVAGGKGASDQWISAGLFSKDRVHHSYKGYHLQGRLLYDALIDALRNNR